MVRLGGRTDVAAIDVGPFVAAFPAFLARWRALDFADGIVRHPVTARPHAGLRVVDGRHPGPGTTYRLLVREEDVPAPTAEEAVVAARLVDADVEAAAEWERGRIAAARATGRVATTWHAYAITVETDDPARTCFTVHHDRTGSRARVEVCPSGPLDVLLEVPDWLGAGGLLSGVVAVRVRVDAGRLPPYGNGEPQLLATVTHPRGRATADLGVAPAAPGRWTVTVAAAAHGAGWLRPLVALAGPVVRRHARRGLAGFLAGLADCLEKLGPELAARYPEPPDPQALAATALADLISAIPVTVPSPESRAAGASEFRAGDAPEP